MTILSEEGVRKIVRKKMMNEIGFRNLYFKSGNYDAIKCDLTKLNQTDLAVKFAKHFIFNPVVTTTIVSAKSLDPKVSVSSKKNILSFIRGHDLSPEEESQYDQIVRAKIEKNPELVKKYVSMLELAITYSFGIFSGIVCKMLTAGIPAQASSQFSIDKNKETTQAQALMIQNVLNKSAENFWRENLTPVNLSSNINKEYSILFPKTMIALNTNADKNKARELFIAEKTQAQNLINPSIIYPSKIFEFISDVVFDDVPNKDTILRPIKELVKNSKDTAEVGNEFQKELIEIFNKASAYFRR